MGRSSSGQTPLRGGGDIDETVLALFSQMGQGFLGKIRASQPGVGLLSQGRGFLVRGGTSQQRAGLLRQGRGFPARGRKSQWVGIGILSWKL